MKKANLLFYACIALNALPVLLFQFFPSMDGPAHLYNANILRHLWAGQSEVLHQWYTVNPAPVPNWTSHVLLAAFGAFLPAYLAEKALLLLYVVGLPLAFRAFVNRISPVHSPMVYLIFPFVYNYLFCLGFYNLSLSIVLLFAGLAISIKQMEAPSTSGWMIQMFLFLLTYFTHPFNFTLLALGAYAIWATHFLFLLTFPPASYWHRFRLSRPHLLRLGLASCIPMVLLFHFYATQHFPNSGERLSMGELMRFLKDVRPLISYHYENELRLTEQLYHLYIALLAIVFYERINEVSGQCYNRLEKWKRLFRPSDLWLGMALFILALLFAVPNGASAGMMSDRFALFFFLFLVVWLAVQPFPRWLWRAATALVLILNFGLVYRYLTVSKNLNRLVAQCVAASRQIDAGSTVLPLNYSENWLAPHFSNYLGIEKPMLILENYEADMGWFPLLWRGVRPSPVLGMDTLRSCLPFQDDALDTTVPIDYVFVLGKMTEADSCQVLLQRAIDRDYERVYGTGEEEVRLFRRRW